MRRLPIYLLLDVSGSMSGEPIATVENGIQTLRTALMSDPHALETAYLSVITFSDSAQQVVPLTELNQFVPPQLKTGGTANLGNALKLVTECANREVIKATPEVRGDWKPFVFIMTNGAVNGDIEEGLAEFKKRKWGHVVACVAGAGADMDELKKITEVVLQMDTADKDDYVRFFKWVTGPREYSDTIVRNGKNDVIDLPPFPDEVANLFSNDDSDSQQPAETIIL